MAHQPQRVPAHLFEKGLHLAPRGIVERRAGWRNRRSHQVEAIDAQPAAASGPAVRRQWPPATAKNRVESQAGADGLDSQIGCRQCRPSPATRQTACRPKPDGPLVMATGCRGLSQPSRSDAARLFTMRSFRPSAVSAAAFFRPAHGRRGISSGVSWRARLAGCRPRGVPT